MPDYMIMDQDSAFMSSLMSCLFKTLKITIKTVGPYNHKSLQTEHGIKSLSNILSKHLTDQGQMWHKFLSLATFSYNIFHSPNLGNYSPYELVFRRKPRILIDIETNPDIKVSGMFKDYLPYIANQETGLPSENVTNLQFETNSSFEQGQGIFSVQ